MSASPIAPRSARLLSVVVPLYNEEAIVPALCDRLLAALRPLGVPFEILAVDDGSRERTRELLVERARVEPTLRVVCLSRNFGLQGAVAAGLSMAGGDAVVLMDGDLQDPPELIPALYREWQMGADIVYAGKHTRAEGGLKRLGIEVFHRLFRRLSEVPVPLNAGNFSLLDRRVLEVINQLPEHNRYLPGLRAWVGFQQVELPFDRAARAAGQARMSARRLVKLALDGVFGFSYLPLRVATLIGLGASLFGVGLTLWVVYAKYIARNAVLAWPSLMIAVCLLGGAQLVCLGILGEYLGRIYDEVRRRPNFVVKEVVWFGQARRAEPEPVRDLSRSA